MKMILAAVLAGAFLISVSPIAKAGDDKAPAGDSAKPDKKAKKKAAKAEKKDEAPKSGGGW